MFFGLSVTILLYDQALLLHTLFKSGFLYMQLRNIEGVCRTVYVIVKCGISLDIIWRCGQNSLRKLSCTVDC